MTNEFVLEAFPSVHMSHVCDDLDPQKMSDALSKLPAEYTKLYHPCFVFLMRGRWYLHLLNTNTTIAIKFCPYCGCDLVNAFDKEMSESGVE